MCSRHKQIISNIKIIQWNCNGILNKLPELDCLFEKEKFNIIALNETRLKEYHSFKFKNFVCYRKDENDSSNRGVLLLIDTIFKTQRINVNSTNIEMVACKITLNSFVLHIASIYCSPNKHISKQDIKNMINIIPDPKILTGDFNSHATAWGCAETNIRGNSLLEIFEEEQA